MMRKMPGMQHAEPSMITLGPGQRGGIVWQFDKAGAVNFACLVPGHMEAGMWGKSKSNAPSADGSPWPLHALRGRALKPIAAHHLSAACNIFVRDVRIESRRMT